MSRVRTVYIGIWLVNVAHALQTFSDPQMVLTKGEWHSETLKIDLNSKTQCCLGGA